MTAGLARLFREHKRDELGLCVSWCPRCAAEAQRVLRGNQRVRAVVQGSLFALKLPDAEAPLVLPARLVLSYPTPSQNEWDSWDKFKRHRWGKRAERDLLASLLTQGLRPDTCTERRAVTVERFGRLGHEMDEANLSGGCKGLLDALVRLGLLCDDSRRWLRAEYVDVRRRGETPHTAVLLSSAEVEAMSEPTHWIVLIEGGAWSDAWFRIVGHTNTREQAVAALGEYKEDRR